MGCYYSVVIPLTTRPSALAQVNARLAERAYWDRVAFELDQELGTAEVEAAMIVAGNDPDAYLASRQAGRVS
jgi:hypothetical protein